MDSSLPNAININSLPMKNDVETNNNVVDVLRQSTVTAGDRLVIPYSVFKKQKYDPLEMFVSCLSSSLFNK